jgi:hypothetical protein
MKAGMEMSYTWVFQALSGRIKSPFGQNCMPRAWKKAFIEAKVKYIPLQQASHYITASQIMPE